MISTLVSTIVQLGIVLLIAGGTYLLFGRRTGPFLSYVGLVRAPLRAIAFGALTGVITAAAILAVPDVAEMASGRGSVAGDAVRHGVDAEILAGLAIAALFKTSLAEELLFRGLIGKRLIARLGFGLGNFIQAVLFGAVHLLLLLVPAATATTVAFMVAATGALGWVSGWLNERLGGGSILPGWAAHGAANLCAYLAVAVA